MDSSTFLSRIFDQFEGKVQTKEEAKHALELGVHKVVIRTAISRPEVITRWFVEVIKTRMFSPIPQEETKKRPTHSSNRDS
ncbi:hypothetical protein B5V89_06425 [Heyndrickxia sporothermodurans]|uniref:hypothetical protein n=1 Tax=Heyndrickxia sporothermodurans TaxID=46224 RepID=UPI000D3C613F|nr:hypothetical protein B5V89_06425 [Heyndrickxia sporothermodurans]